VEILESQLSTYGKSVGEDRLREEVQRLMEEKEVYQEVAKETLTKVTQIFLMKNLKNGGIKKTRFLRSPMRNWLPRATQLISKSNLAPLKKRKFFLETSTSEVVKKVRN